MSHTSSSKKRPSEEPSASGSDFAARIASILKRLKTQYKSPRCALNFTTPFEILAATILSAQTTDLHVNRVTEALFKKYRTIRDYASAPAEQFRKDVNSVNFYNNKAKNIQACANLILKDHGGEVPRTMEELTALPGIARKTANIILSSAYGITEGIAVDTHVRRLSQRLGLTKQDDPVKIEQELMAATPKKDWTALSHLLIMHGRQVCQAKKPDHAACVLFDICPSRDI